jgi:UDP-N-acetylmuramoylalanine--D-glutamate ligase
MAHNMERSRSIYPSLRLAGGHLLESRQAGLRRTHGSAHGLQPVGERGGVLYVNDSRATFLDASLASIAELRAPFVWIAGAWSDDLTEGVAQEFGLDRLRAVVLFGAGHDHHAFEDGGRLFVADDVRSATLLASRIAARGEVVLFSPACPSGHQYANYEERGTDFKRAVNEL